MHMAHKYGTRQEYQPAGKLCFYVAFKAWSWWGPTSCKLWSLRCMNKVQRDCLVIYNAWRGWILDYQRQIQHSCSRGVFAPGSPDYKPSTLTTRKVLPSGEMNIDCVKKSNVRSMFSVCCSSWSRGPYFLFQQWDNGDCRGLDHHNSTVFYLFSWFRYLISIILHLYYLYFSDGDGDFQKPKKIKLKSPKVCRKFSSQGSVEESAVLKCFVSKSKQHAKRRRQERLCSTTLLGRSTVESVWNNYKSY